MLARKGGISSWEGGFDQKFLTLLLLLHENHVMGESEKRLKINKHPNRLLSTREYCQFLKNII